MSFATAGGPPTPQPTRACRLNCGRAQLSGEGKVGGNHDACEGRADLRIVRGPLAALSPERYAHVEERLYSF